MSDKHNTIKSKGNNNQTIEVYENDIYIYVEEYLDTLKDRDDIYNNGSLFTGMIKYVHKHVFKNNKPSYDNIELLDSIWDVYTTLCYQYGKRPTLLNFSLLIGIDPSTFNTWASGQYRGNGLGINSAHSKTVKRWMKECESSLADGATEKNSIGCIFALKANYGWTEQPQRIEIVGNNTPQLTETEIAQIVDSGAEDVDIEPEF